MEKITSGAPTTNPEHGLQALSSNDESTTDAVQERHENGECIEGEV